MEEQLVRSQLRDVKKIAQTAPTLDAFGKRTMLQTATLMDFSQTARPILEQNLKSESDDWKIRYWITDLLGTIGDERSAEQLYALAASRREHRAVRLRAVQSLSAITEKLPEAQRAQWRQKLSSISK